MRICIFYFQEGFTPLHVAASQGCKGILASMIQHGANLNKQCKVQMYISIFPSMRIPLYNDVHSSSMHIIHA